MSIHDNLPRFSRTTNDRMPRWQARQYLKDMDRAFDEYLESQAERAGYITLRDGTKVER